MNQVNWKQDQGTEFVAQSTTVPPGPGKIMQETSLEISIEAELLQLRQLSRLSTRLLIQ